LLTAQQKTTSIAENRLSNIKQTQPQTKHNKKTRLKGEVVSSHQRIDKIKGVNLTSVTIKFSPEK
jgi:hypothetical protein